ncbi:class I SAM-dependent methyltransferase [Streptomyces sp. SID3343]|uniref:class I SAM-dependent methyltransferase n=1 Tax=Streptomyces sp. SID3343 TaxID=2690260 RepID=UPI00136BD4E1|nr:class I SAM-dependent methyltransferase [Streptomyces sp. SID3343]MYW05392.1 methyltransferase domain-containing protein [Streptomyces sp. SID3343]
MGTAAGARGPGGAARPRGTAGYGEAAEALAEQYEGVTFADVHRDVLHLFPDAPSRVVDLGAGSGRDAAALAALGHRVVAVEPTDELRRLGERIHAGAGVEWVDDSLPELAGVQGPFDVVLLTAVWMHLDEAERLAGMRRILTLSAPGARVVMTLRHGPVPEGRRMWDVSAPETVELADRFGFRPLYVGARTDLHARSGVRWTMVVLEDGRAAS